MERQDHRQGRARHLASPRTLAFLERDGRWLFLRGGPAKWFAGRLNGVGGHVEPGEAVDAAARREVREETGLAADRLDLAAIVHVIAEPAAILFVYRGRLPPGDLHACAEGDLCWRAADEVRRGGSEYLADLVLLFPVVLAHTAGAPALSLVLDQSGPDGPLLR